MDFYQLFSLRTLARKQHSNEKSYSQVIVHWNRQKLIPTLNIFVWFRIFDTRSKCLSANNFVETSNTSLVRLYIQKLVRQRGNVRLREGTNGFRMSSVTRTVSWQHSGVSVFPRQHRRLTLSIGDSRRASIPSPTAPSRGVSNLRSDEPQAANSRLLDPGQ